MSEKSIQDNKEGKGSVGGKQGHQAGHRSSANFSRGSKNNSGPAPEFEQALVDLARVTRVTSGGKRMNFRALVVLGDKKNRIGYGVAKGSDVTIAINKAVVQANRKMMTVKMKAGSIPHEIKEKFKAAIVALRPAQKGRGIIAGGPVRTVLSLAGYKDVLAKMIGSKNKINNVKATFNALGKLKNE
jgi:small subunit ribosomal protein S5